MRRSLAIVLTLAVSLVTAGGAQALMVSDNGTTAGVALVPGTRGGSLPAGVAAVTSSGPCSDPALSSDLGGPVLPNNGLCYHGGGVIHKNETFALTWDQPRAYWSGTRGYVERFLRDVADGSGTLTSPYSVTTQYTDGGGRAQNASVYGGGCIDYGAVGGSACEFGNPTGAGHDYPANGCTPKGDSFIDVNEISPNGVCLTDSQLRAELAAMVSETGIVGRTEPGYTPVVTLLLPAGVETCLDPARNLCSANAFLAPTPPTPSTSTTGGTIPADTYRVEVTYITATGESLPSAPKTVTTTGTTSTITIDSPPSAPGATGWNVYVTRADGQTYVGQQSSPNAIGTPLTLSAVAGAGPAPAHPTAFCSYHSVLDVGGTKVAYVVQPWTAVTSCDEPDAPAIPQNPTPQQLSVDVGLRLVSSISQAQIASIVNPALDGWFALGGSEIDDNHGCTPLANGLDSVRVGASSQNPYLLQREFNNAGVIESEPTTYFGCAPGILLTPAFVVPSAVNRGDVVEFDGSATASTLIVPRADYTWSFGDGTTAVGPSVAHSYAKGGSYTVKLYVMDRGGNVASLSQTISVLGAGGQVVTPPPTARSLGVHLQLMPEGLRTVLRKGITVRLTSNRSADGFVTISISRAAADRAHIRHGRGATVVIGRGTLSGIKAGTATLHLRLSRAAAAKLKRLSHVALTVRLALVEPGGGHLAIVVAGRY
jgi:PKD domain